MGSYHGPKARIQRRFGETLMSAPKYSRILEKRGYPPGQHGKTRRPGKKTSYALQLDEKQKLAFMYNVRERQLRNQFMKALRKPGNTGTNMLQFLECRLDNLVYRAGLAPSIWSARQLVGHGHVLVNNKRVNIPSYSVKPGEGITVTEKMRKNALVKETMEARTETLPYLDVNKEGLSFSFTRIPERTEIPAPVNEQLVVEFYARFA